MSRSTADLQSMNLSQPVRIGVDGRRLGKQPKGIGRYIWELCNGLDKVLPAAQFFLYMPKPVDLPPISSRWTLRVDDSTVGRRLPSNVWLIARAGRLSRRDDLDAFWSGSGLLPLVGLKPRGVLTVHDLVHKVAPQTMDFHALWASRLFFYSSLRRADAVVSNSIGTARRLEEHSRCKVAAVVQPGLSGTFQRRSESQVRAVLARYRLVKPYFLAVSTWEPRKGLEPLIRAFLRIKADSLIGDYKLVLVGDRGWKDAAIMELAQHHRQSVVSLGFVDDSSLASLYSGADAFIYPSSYEGFGMPVLEARACGTRVVTSDIPELREAGGDDAIYIAPNEEGIREGILTVFRSGVAKAINWRDWSWNKSAAILAEVLLGPSFAKFAHPARIKELPLTSISAS